jgi:hypothetical protein
MNTATRLKGVIRPPVVSLAQTDGSYWSHYGIGRTAVHFTNNHKGGSIYTFVNTYHETRNSTEAEWISVMDGVLYGSMKCPAIHLENDNLGVVQKIIGQAKPKYAWEREYRDFIYDIVKHDLEYMTISWIPRELNKADALFR